MSRLVILAASVFELSCRKTDRQTNRGINPISVTAIGVGNEHDVWMCLHLLHKFKEF